MKEFEGKLCVVTGAARGIGKAVAVKFAEKGAGVAMLDINRELLAVSAGEVAERYGVKTWPVYVDASSTDSINQAMDQVLEAAGTPDVLANCAGISTSRKLLDVEDGEWDRVMNINLRPGSRETGRAHCLDLLPGVQTGGVWQRRVFHLQGRR